MPNRSAEPDFELPPEHDAGQTMRGTDGPGGVADRAASAAETAAIEPRRVDKFTFIGQVESVDGGGSVSISDLL
jgi:hypothetical protein